MHYPKIQSRKCLCNFLSSVEIDLFSRKMDLVTSPMVSLWLGEALAWLADN